MSGGNLMIGFVAAFGFVPLGIVIYKRRRADRIISTGKSAQAVVYHIEINRKSNNQVVYYHFIAEDGKQYTGNLICRPDLYKMNDHVEVFYKPGNPKLNTIKGAWKSNIILIVMIVIAIWVLVMMYQLYLTQNSLTP